jgi:hypothetical protein
VTLHRRSGSVAPGQALAFEKIGDEPCHLTEVAHQGRALRQNIRRLGQ